MVSAGLPHVCHQLRVDRLGEGTWAPSPIMQRDSPAHSPGGNCQDQQDQLERAIPCPRIFRLGLCHVCYWATSPIRSPARARDRLHVSVRRKVWPCFCSLHKLQNPEGSSFGRQTCHLGGGGNRKCSPGSSTPLSPERLEWPQRGQGGRVSGPRNSRAAAAETTEADAAQAPGGHAEAVEMAHVPNMRTRILFTPLLHPLLSPPLLLHVWDVEHLSKSLSACGGRQGSVWPQPSPVTQACAAEREKAASVLRTEKESTQTAFQTGIDSLPCRAGHSGTVLQNSKLKSFL